MTALRMSDERCEHLVRFPMENCPECLLAALAAAEKERDELRTMLDREFCDNVGGEKCANDPPCGSHAMGERIDKIEAERDAWRRESLAWRKHDARNVIPGTHYIHSELRNARDTRAENEAAGLK